MTATAVDLFRRAAPAAERPGPVPEGRGGAAAARDPVAYRGLLVLLFASIFLQRFSVPGVTIVALNLAVTAGVMAVLVMRRAVVIEVARLALFLAFSTAVMLSAALNAGTVSLPSVALVWAIMLPYCFVLRRPEGVFEGCLAAFQTMVLVLALGGLAQFVLQFAIGSGGLFTFQGIVPPELLLEGFNTANPLRWDSPFLKSNGFFLLEPSTFSQYLALGIVFELLFRGVTPRLAVYCLALPTSYSGTGIILLLVVIPCLLAYRRDYRVLVGIAVLGALAAATGDLWNSDALLSRAGEFGSEDTSAYARFFAGARMTGEYLMGSVLTVAFGLGPGSFAAHAKLVAYEAHDPVWIKVLFEYGLLGVALFWPMMLAVFFGRAPSRWVGASLLIGYLVFGGMLLDPRLQAMILVFCALPGSPGTAPAVARPPLRAADRAIA